jgi:flagellar basal-body rod modification protein FlgD
VPIDSPGVTPISSLSSAAVGAGASQRSNTLDRDTFLKLLVAQLRNQDPTSPVEGAEFLAQTAQFTVVEKLEQMAQQNADLLAATRLSGASTMLGRSVTYRDPDGAEATGPVQSVRIEVEGLVLRIGDHDVPAGAVLGIADTRPLDPAP